MQPPPSSPTGTPDAASIAIAQADWTAEQWRRICEQAPLRLAVFDGDSRYMAASGPWIDEYEGGRTHLRGEPYFALHPDAPAQWREIHRRALDGETCREEVEHFALADGTEVWGRWVCMPWHRPDGAIGGFLVSIENTTAQHLALRKLHAAEQELHLALEAARAGLWEANLRTGWNKWSDETWKLYGLAREGLEASTDLWRESVEPGSRERIMEPILAAVGRGQPFDAEWRVDLAGEERWLFCRGKPMAEADGSIERYLGVVIDISARKKAELEAAAQAREVRSILDALPVLVSHVDGEMRYIFVNRCYERSFGITSEQVVGKTIGEVIGEEAAARARAHFPAVRAGKVVTFETELCFADGMLHSLEVSFVPDRDAGGRVSGYFAVSVDISEKRRADAELSRMRSRLESLTRRQIAQQTIMAVGHELRQPLQAATVFAEAARRMLPPENVPEDLGRAIGRTADEIGRAGRVLAQLFETVQGAADGEPAATIAADLNRIASHVLDAWKAEQGCGPACLAYTPSEGQLLVTADPAVIEKILFNLLRNACEAVGCCRGSRWPAGIALRASRRNDEAVLRVEDNGGGVPPDRQADLFIPFRSTKPAGLGLGLAISRQLVELHGGAIWHEDRPGGSAFCISLPLAP